MKRSWWERFKAKANEPAEPSMLGMPTEYFEHRARREEAAARQDILFQISQELARIAAAMERSNDLAAQSNDLAKRSNDLVRRMAGADVYEVRRDDDVEG